MKYTPWFTDGQKPARPGVYQQRCSLGKQLGYQRWDGVHWYAWSLSPQKAAASNVIADDCFQNDPWRGLAKGKNK
jgi:hypothetical protein